MSWVTDYDAAIDAVGELSERDALWVAFRCAAEQPALVLSAVAALREQHARTGAVS